MDWESPLNAFHAFVIMRHPWNGDHKRSRSIYMGAVEDEPAPFVQGGLQPPQD